MITSFTAGDNLTCIDWNAFEHCSNLQTVTVGSGLERIWGNAFNYCFKLKDFYSSSLHEIDFNPTYSPFYYGAAITFHGPHGSGLLPIIQDYPNCSFDVTDRHQEPEWSWSEDMRSAVARFDCGGTCTLSPCILTDTEIEVTVGPTGTVYTASVTLEGEEYIDVRSISYWAALQAQIDAAEDGAVITLNRDLTAVEGDGSLNIPYGKTLTIDLNGHTLDRGLSAKQADGCAIIVRGHLTLRNGSITGANCSGLYGGAVYAYYDACLTLRDCTFINNEAGAGGGAIYGESPLHYYSTQIEAATIRLSGSLEISGDPVSVGVNDLCLGREGFALEIVGALTNTAPIPVSLGSGLTRPDQLVFTGDLAGSGTAESFVSVSDEYLVFLTDAGEAALAAKSEVVFVPGEGAGDMEPVTAACGSPFSLPACDFDAPTGKVFTGRWIVEQLDSLDEADAEAVENGITAGTSETTFSPGSACTRAQIVAFLWRAAGSPAPTAAENPFLDVSTDAWYAEAVLWAWESGITEGVSAGSFAPNKACTRAEIVTFLWLLDGSPEPSQIETGFADVPAWAWYAKAVAWALENGITAGTGPGAFSPGQTCTRAEAVSFLYARSRS